MNQWAVIQYVILAVTGNAFDSQIIEGFIEDYGIFDPAEILIVIRLIFDDRQEVLALDHEQSREIDTANADVSRRSCEETDFSKTRAFRESLQRCNLYFTTCAVVSVDE